MQASSYRVWAPPLCSQTRVVSCEYWAVLISTRVSEYCWVILLNFVKINDFCTKSNFAWKIEFCYGALQQMHQCVGPSLAHVVVCHSFSVELLDPMHTHCQEIDPCCPNREWNLNPRKENAYETSFCKTSTIVFKFRRDKWRSSPVSQPKGSSSVFI